MVHRLSPLRLIVLFLLFAPVAIASGSNLGPQIPSVHGTTFSDNKVDLPEDLQGKVGILVVGFSQSSRDGVTEWGKKLAVDYADSPNVMYYAMPVLASVPKMMRGMVQGRIKSSVSDRGRPHFLPLIDNEMSWRALAHYNRPDDAYILLVDGNGRVRWQSQGPPVEATYAELKQQVESLRQH
jgi:hypothetical protein